MSKFSFNDSQDIKLLLVEDEKSLAKYLQISLRDEAGNVFNVKNASYLKEALDCAENEEFDVVLLDLNLPDSNGMDTLIKFRQRFPDVAVVILTGLEDKEFSLQAVKEGAQDYLVKGETEAGVLVRSIFYAIERNRFILDRRKGRIELEESYEKLKTISDGIILAMEKIVETRDPYTAGHQRRVAQLAKAIAIKLHLPKETVNAIFIGGIIHDIGKIYVPAEILSKPGKLSTIEFSIIKTHPQVGYDILKNINFPFPVDKIVFQHHERMDGSGYPLGLQQDEIMIEAKIISVADVMEAMASIRPYRAALGPDAALSEIKTNRGKLYYSDAVDACVELFEKDNFTFDK